MLDILCNSCTLRCNMLFIFSAWIWNLIKSDLWITILSPISFWSFPVPPWHHLSWMNAWMHKYVQLVMIEKPTWHKWSRLKVNKVPSVIWLKANMAGSVRDWKQTEKVWLVYNSNGKVPFIHRLTSITIQWSSNVVQWKITELLVEVMWLQTY